MQEDTDQDRGTPSSSEQLECYKQLKKKLTALKDKERQLLMQRSIAKSQYRESHPVAPVAVKDSLVGEDLKLLLMRDGISQSEYVMESADLPVCKVRNGEQIVAANQTFLDFLGFSREELLSGQITLARISTNEALASEREQVKQFAKHAVTTAFESERLTRDGWRKPVAATLRITSVEPLEYLAFWLDLSDLRYLEESLKERNAIFSAIVDEMPHIVYVSNQDGLMRHFNQRFYELTGVSALNDDGAALKKALHPVDLPAFERAFKRTVEEQAPFMGDYRLRAQDGDYYWHTFRLVPLKSVNGLLALTVQNGLEQSAWQDFQKEESLLWIGTATDIDRRKRIMDEVLASAQAFQSLANQIPQIVWTAAPDGKIDFFNERWYEFSGHSREQRVGLDFALFIHPDDRRAYLNSWKTSVRTGDAFEVDFRLREFVKRSSRFKDEHEYVRFLARAVALRNYRGEIAQWIGTWTSI